MRLGSLGSVDYEDRDLGPAKLILSEVGFIEALGYLFHYLDGSRGNGIKENLSVRF